MIKNTIIPREMHKREEDERLRQQEAANAVRKVKIILIVSMLLTFVVAGPCALQL